MWMKIMIKYMAAAQYFRTMHAVSMDETIIVLVHVLLCVMVLDGIRIHMCGQDVRSIHCYPIQTRTSDAIQIKRIIGQQKHCFIVDSEQRKEHKEPGNNDLFVIWSWTDLEFVEQQNNMRSLLIEWCVHA
eukprot:178704_1